MTAWINGKLTCVSNATYATGYGADIDTGNGNWTTISKISECDGVWPVKKGDTIKLEAAYDEILHPAYVVITISTILKAEETLMCPKYRRKSDGVEQMEMGIMAFTFVEA